ncbi:hypothetical protein D3C81_1751250 [compost metagenome]
MGQGGHPLAVEERQHAHTFSADRRVGHKRVELIDVEVQQVADQPGGIGQVHGADQRQPAAGGRAERGNGGIRGDVRPVGIGVHRA